MPSVTSTQLFPEVVDASTLQPRLTSSIYLPIAVEGQADTAGGGTVGTVYSVARIDEANTAFGPASKLTALIKAVLDRGAGPVVAIASAKGGTAPTLVQRQAEWEKMASDPNIRIRLTDSTTEADLAALSVSCKEADLLNNKQIAVVGMPAGTTKAAMISSADAIAMDAVGATRVCFTGPGVYDDTGTLRDGAYLAAALAAEIAKNSDPSNDLDLWQIPLLTGVEKDTFGMASLRRRVVAGAAVNDYEDLLQQGVSPVMPTRIGGGVQTTHLRTVYQTDTRYDNLYTRVIADQVFLDVKTWIEGGNFLRMGNTADVRNRIASGVEAVLTERRNWIRPLVQPDGTDGYLVSVTPSADERQITVSYQGVVVRGINTIQVAANLTIPV